LSAASIAMTIRRVYVCGRSEQPTQPVISGYQESEQVTAGDVVELACTAAVPRDALGWHRADQQRLSSNCTTTSSDGGRGQAVSTCRLTVVTRPDHNGAVYNCTATHRSSTTVVAMTSLIRLTVLCEFIKVKDDLDSMLQQVTDLLARLRDTPPVL